LLLLLLPVASAVAQTTPGTYVDRWTLSTTATFMGRIQIASAVTANLVLEESASTPNHAQRFALAQRVANEPDFLARRLAPLIASSIPVEVTDDGNPATPPVVETPWTDVQLQNLITNKWNLLASAFVPVSSQPPLLLTAPAAPKSGGQP